MDQGQAETILNLNAVNLISGRLKADGDNRVLNIGNRTRVNAHTVQFYTTNNSIIHLLDKAILDINQCKANVKVGSDGTNKLNNARLIYNFWQEGNVEIIGDDCVLMGSGADVIVQNGATHPCLLGVVNLTDNGGIDIRQI
jgi:hypothetical protein